MANALLVNSIKLYIYIIHSAYDSVIYSDIYLLNYPQTPPSGVQTERKWNQIKLKTKREIILHSRKDGFITTFHYKSVL